MHTKQAKAQKNRPTNHSRDKLAAVILCLAIVGSLYAINRSRQPASVNATNVSCDTGIGSAHGAHSTSTNTEPESIGILAPPVAGANWRHPNGPDSNLAGKEKHPVVHIAYEDAAAYAKWAGKRLPTEAEFEFAARGGLDRKRFAWGDEFKPGDKFQANSFQGHFPDTNTGEDGYAGTAPVGRFAPNGFGLFDMAGNVWEWTADWYRPDYYKTLAATNSVTRNPQGPSDSFDPSEPGVAKRVHKGGSYLCTDEYCARYMPGGRGKGEPDTGTNHVGFRCVRSSK